MKKILIITPSFNSGGTTTSLMNFVSTLDKTKYDIWVYPMNNDGPNREFIAKHCHIIGYSTSKEAHIVSSPNKLYRSVFWFIKSTKKRLQKWGIDISPIVFKFVSIKLDKGRYDYVIAFQEGLATQLCSFFKHGIKIAWVRAEYGRYLKLAKKKPEIKLYQQFDTIINVSKAAASNFTSHLPMYKEKTCVLYNIINAKRIISMANEPIQDDYFTNSFVIISVGRIDPVKRFSEIPKIASELKNKGIEFKWLIIGEVASQEEMDLISHNLNKYNQRNNVVFLGRKANPYPYIKHSNLLVCLSSSETFNNTLTEAKILGVPVVTTDFECACESIHDNIDGYISTINLISDKIERMIKDADTYKQIKSNLNKFHYSNKETIDKLYSTILK